MSTATSISGEDHDRQLHETIVLSTKQIVASIEASNARVEASNAGIQALLCKVVESQTHSQQQMMELLKILANNNWINDAGISTDETAGECSCVISSNLNPKDQVDRVAEIGPLSDNNRQPVEDVLLPLKYTRGIAQASVKGGQVNEEDEQVNRWGDDYDFRGYEPLREAIQAQDWEKAKKYLNDHQTDIREIFETRDSTKEIGTILHAAASIHQWKFLEEIVKLVPPVTLEYVNPQYGGTILHFAAILGNIKAVKVLVEKNSNLTQIRGSREPYHVPLLMAAVNATDGEKKVVEYLCSVTRDEDPSPFSGICGLTLVTSLIQSDMCGLALSVCKRFPRLINDQHGPELIFSSLITIAGRPFAFLSGSKLKWWERCIYSLIQENMDSIPRNGGIIEGKRKLLKSSESTQNDEENPRVTSKVSAIIREHSLTSNAGRITNYISLYIMHYIIQVPCIKELYNQKLMHKQVVSLVTYFIGHLSKTYNTTTITNLFLKSNILGIAIKFGTTEFVLECLRYFLTYVFIRERNEMIYNFIYILRQRAKLDGHPILYKNNNTILHFSAELAHNRQLNCVSGAAFQMQREIQWFKVNSYIRLIRVENTMPQKERFIRNSDGDTAHFLFTVKHRDLMEKGEKWMKETSSSCMVVAALIATVAFAAAITVPGGNISDNTSKKNGIPVFLDRKSFMVFAVTDALALFSSITSVIMFLAVYTSRYSEEDFLKSLPQKIIIGLSTLFISMATILVAFGAALTIVLGKRISWAPLLATLLGCAPVLLFGFLQFPLLVEMVSSTYWPIVLGKQNHHEPYLEYDDIYKKLYGQAEHS
ncbi:hypothetical protein MKW92_028778 [Papaver armeniacum]|nr:hypothetical protein MKW92_028778 [Papaver armeniacum]